MDVGVYSYSHGDPLLVDKIVNEFLSQGKFDKLRKECMSDADTKPAYQNLQQRVETTVAQFLKKQIWKPDLNKNQLRDSLRKHILESGFFDAGINRIVDQVVSPNVLATVFLPEVEEVVYSYLSIPRPLDKNNKKAGQLSGDDKVKQTGENEDKSVLNNEKDEKGKVEGNGKQDVDQVQGISMFKMASKDSHLPTDTIKVEPSSENKTKKLEGLRNANIKSEEKIKSEPEDSKPYESIETEMRGSFEQLSLPSEDSQESLSRMGVERLQISDTDGNPAPDSDDSIPLEINEKSMSEIRDSEDSIMNQMSPISQGRLTPDILEEEKVSPKEEKVEKEEKKPLSFIGRIPKLKKEDPYLPQAKEDTPKREKVEMKSSYSSDESDSSKSHGKSDSDDRKAKESRNGEKKLEKDERKYQEDGEKAKKYDNRGKSTKDKDFYKKRDDKSKDSGGSKNERSRERHESKKSGSSSSSKERSSSHHKSSHRHKDSRSRDEKKKKEEEKKKSKSTDDHGKERNKKEDRRSTDRDSNERERDRSSGSRSQGESKRRDKEQKTEESRETNRGQKEEADVENEAEIQPELEEVVEVNGNEIPEEEIIMVNEEWVCFDGLPEVVPSEVPCETEVTDGLDFNELYQNGFLTEFRFPELTDDFYVKFDSTGFRYFEDWEKAKLDCEEEFKEFVDEAENDLDLLSDEESDLETGGEFNFVEENRRTISNLLRGVGNFKNSIMFDPKTSHFYKWANSKCYQKFRRKSERKERRQKESDESIKENIGRECSSLSEDSEFHEEKNKENQTRENIALHLKLLKRYRSKAMRMGKHRRKHKRRKDMESRGIKEKNENRNISLIAVQNGFLYKSEVRETDNHFLGSNYPERTVKKDKTNPETRLVEFMTETNVKTDAVTDAKNVTEVFGFNKFQSELMEEVEVPDVTTTRDYLVDEEDGFKESQKRRGDIYETKPKPQSPDSQENSLSLPLTPDSDDITANGDVSRISKNKRPHGKREGGPPRKQNRRNYSQKYDSHDLYKPRSNWNSSRSRGKEKVADSGIEISQF